MSDLNSMVNNWLVASLVYSVKTRWAKEFLADKVTKYVSRNWFDVRKDVILVVTRLKAFYIYFAT